jgi:hypothetical protein
VTVRVIVRLAVLEEPMDDSIDEPFPYALAVVTFLALRAVKRICL